MQLTDSQWNRVAPHITHIIRADKRGKKRLDDRLVLEGILWVLKTGAQWRQLPKEYPSYQTCHRRFQEWRENRIFQKILTELAEDLSAKGKLRTDEAFIDASFARAKKGGLVSALPRSEKARRSWLFQTIVLFRLLSTSRAPRLTR